MSPSPPPQPNPFASIIDVLRSSLGEEGARTIVLREAEAAGLTVLRTNADALGLLRRIESLGGTAALAARLAIGRLSRGVPLSSLTDSPSVATTQPAKSPSVDQPTKGLTQGQVIALLARALGDEKATEAVQKAALELRIAGPMLTSVDVGRLLDHLVTKGGGLGTVARFAKVRFMLAS